MVDSCQIDGEPQSTAGHLDLSAAMRCCEEALLNNPRNTSALYSLGRCRVESRDMEGAEAAVDRLLDLDRSSYEASVLRGHISLWRGRLADAYESFVSAYCRAEHRDRFLVYGISLFCEAVGDYAEARAWLVLLIRLGVEEHKSYEVLFRTGVCLKKMNLLCSSANVFRVIVYSPLRSICNPGAQIQMAHLHEMQMRHNLAVEILDSVGNKHRLAASRLHAWIEFKTADFAAVKRRCDDADPYLIYLDGRARHIEGGYEDALERYSRAAQIDPMDGMVQHSVGCAYFQLDQLLSAKKAFLGILKTSPGCDGVEESLALVEEALSRRLNGESYSDLRVHDPPPSIERTRYLDSQEFFGGPCADSGFHRALPFRTSRLELLPG